MTSQTLTEKVLSDHLVGGELTPGESIDLDIDQVLLQDILGPLVWMEFEALEFETVETDVAVTYCDHQVYQFDSADTDTHRYLRTASQAYGGHFSKPGNGICHQVHRERFIEPGATLLGSDSHSTTMGGFGAIGIGAGGLDVATAMGGGAYTVEMPEVVEVHLTGELGEWTSAKDVILELLRRHSVKGGVGKLFEFTGPGVETLSVPERCTITNMTTELGATTAIFPSDERTRRHLTRLGRGDAYRELSADADATYDDRLEVDLSEIEPLIAMPSMPDNVVPVSEAAGTPVDQCLVGTCTNGSYFDIATAAAVVKGETVAPETEFVIAPASKRSAEVLAREGRTEDLYAAGVNLSESTCGACIGQGHVPAPDSVSLRAFNRNFKGRSGLPDDSVYLASPEVVAASAIAGEITDPRDMGRDAPSVSLPDDMTRTDAEILGPEPSTEVRKGDTIGSVPLKDPLAEQIAGTVITKAGDNVTTDHIVPANAEVMTLWSDPQACADYTLVRVDEDFPEKARAADGGWVVAGENYGQGSSRENAALELAVLGVDGVIAQSFARIHFANLVNFGVVPLTFADAEAYDNVDEGDTLEVVGDLASQIRAGDEQVTVEVNGEWTFEADVTLTPKERETLLAGGKLSLLKNEA
ncbi:aconitate hydratase [Halobellus sp. Atlit-38R]|uniref:aconitate hydratase n=1 Tax=Halobellus sp. Atlit-38R TaxID=2282131 RepID=UPI000EF19773|nr:aconitate hydratase [Halobellus sp. Atlit-38R]RLM89341.1 aconitate hydratase [Halobellus sp. Atlit-38R]